MKYLLDTNMCIYTIKNRPPQVKEKLIEHKIGDLALSIITVSELLYGAFKSQQVERNLNIIEEFIMPFDIIDFDYKSAIEYGKIRAILEKQGQIIKNMDIQIAAIAKANDMILVTNNLKEFNRIKNLKLENWV